MLPMTPVAALMSFAILGFAAPDPESQNAHRRALFEPASQIALQPVAKIVIDGKAVAGFVLSPKPYARGEGHGVCTAVGPVEAKTGDGVPISAFEFIGWQVGSSYEVVVFGVVADEGPCDGPRFRFERLRLGFGQELVFEKMEAVGVTPWTIRVEPWDDIPVANRPHLRINASFVIRR